VDTFGKLVKSQESELPGGPMVLNKIIDPFGI